MNLKPKVTIGICGKNCADIIGLAVESAVQQDFPHKLMEIIFVDDGSEDNTLKVMRDYASKIDIATKIFSSGWNGLGKSRNTVINNAKGDYIIWLDHDETLEKGFVHKQVNLMEQNPKAGIVTAKLGILPRENLVLTLDLLPSVVEYSCQDWKKPSKLPGTGGATYRLKTAKEVGGFNENIKGNGEDIDMASRVKQAGWLILRGNAIFYERHGKMATWKNLLKRNFNQGIQSRRLYLKTNKFYSIYRMNPIASFVAGLNYTVFSYRITKQKVAFLLPFHFTLKMMAWFYGFTRK